MRISDFKIGQDIEVVVSKVGKGHGRGSSRKKGKVEAANSKFLVIDTGNYKMSFTRTDFMMGLVKVVKVG